MIGAALVGAVSALLAARAAREAARQTRPSNGTTLATMVESQVAWSVAHTQQDRQNFLVLARHFGIDRPSWISGSQTPRNVDIVSAFPQVTALPLRAEALSGAVGYLWAHGGPAAPWRPCPSVTSRCAR